VVINPHLLKEIFLKGWYLSYMRSLEKSPVITKSFTAGIINGIGDILSQMIENRTSDLGISMYLNQARVL